MRLSLLALLGAAVLVQAQSCPELPDTGVTIGQPVPIRPQDIPAGCSDLEILVARGTSEPNYANGGKFGIVVGDPVVSNVSLILPGARGYPVQYPASIDIIGGGIQGKYDVLNRLLLQNTKCPKQKFALVGYSQGAGIIHSAAKLIPTSLYPKIVAVALFGDPALKSALGDKLPSALAAKLLESCAVGDPVCDPNAGSCTYYHLTYIRPEWINRAVNFIVNAYRGTPLPPSTSVGLRKMRRGIEIVEMA